MTVGLSRGGSGYVYALMRIVVGLAFAQHGAQKLFGVFGGVDGGGATVEILSLMGVAGVIELGGGLLVAIGLLTRLAAFLASGLMAFAYFMAHAGRGFWPIENQGELAVLFCFVFLYIAFRGGGLGGFRR
ncbi:MAG: DoxX family protein [Deltaproteobacteria bacterium]|nr:DoxX family protein [Deltaproteobacteria bacterium]